MFHQLFLSTLPKFHIKIPYLLKSDPVLQKNDYKHFVFNVFFNTGPDF